MYKKSFVSLAAALLSMVTGMAAADIVCYDGSYCTATFSRTYTGNYNPGQPYDYVTVAPDGTGETFAQFGITIRVFLKNCQGVPIVGVPAQQIALFSPDLCICPDGAHSDAATDANGMATFSGTLKAGGCVTRVDVYAEGTYIDTVRGPSPDLVSVKLNSTDAASQGISPCFTDSADLAGFAARIGKSTQYNICWDYNESGGPTIDSADLAFFASVIGAACN